ncbi:hypothetical protein [Kordia jejudonensis]|uniref:hypothetical protein n=1 Tax=Kordia jejudonensis TaxID=1348245 RepID=UPI0006290606|nr:hypothetical protein [Kordia jejudonensis]
MEYSSKRYAVVNKPTPEVALYFDHVFCLDRNTQSVFPTANNFYLPDEGREIPNLVLKTSETAGIDNWIFKKVISIQAAALFNKHFAGKAHIDVYKVADYVQQDKLHNFIDFKEIIQNDSFEYTDDDILFYFKNFLIIATTNIFRKTGKYIVPIFQDMKQKEWFQQENFTVPNLQNGIELSLLNTPIIDTAQLDWLHVNEVREDDESIHQLRNLRLFLDKIDSAKGANYIQDVISQKIFNYEKAAQKHGFNTKKDVISAFLNLEHIPKMLAYGVISLVEPSLLPLTGTLGITEINGAVKEIGNISLELKNKKISKGLTPIDKDVEYLISIREKIDNE